MQQSYFAHQRQETAPLNPDTQDLPPLPELRPIDPHEFVIGQRKNLDASAQEWRDIAKGSQKYEPDYVGSIGKSLRYIWHAYHPGVPLPSVEILDNQTNVTLKEFTTYSVQVVRHFTRSPAESISDGMGKAWDFGTFFTGVSDATAMELIKTPTFPYKKFMFQQTRMRAAMEATDRRMHSTLGALIKNYQSQPEELEAMAELYDTGIADIDPRYKELRQMIATDWHHPLPEQSKLRSFCQSLFQTPDVFLPSFVRTAAEAEGNQQWLAVQTMARYAIASRGGADPITTEHIQRQLAATYARWGEFADLDTLFNTHVTEKVASIIGLFDAIAGHRPDTKNIRTYPSDEQIAQLRANIRIRIAEDRRGRRRQTRKHNKVSKIHQLPDSESIAKTAAPPEMEREPRPLKSLKNSAEGTFASDVTPEEFVDQLKFPEGSSLIADLKNVLSWLQKNPISEASKILESQIRVVHKGKQLRLRRLAIEKTDVKIDRNSKYYRLVYAFTKDGILLVDALDHATFDNKYK